MKKGFIVFLTVPDRWDSRSREELAKKGGSNDLIRKNGEICIFDNLEVASMEVIKASVKIGVEHMCCEAHFMNIENLTITKESIDSLMDKYSISEGPWGGYYSIGDQDYKVEENYHY